jgi:site-specific recombinase XerD
MMPKPIFDTLEHLSLSPPSFLKEMSIVGIDKEYTICLEFLKTYSYSKETFNVYRREVERLLQWSWYVNQGLLKNLTNASIRAYIEFVENPPSVWVGTLSTQRFIIKGGVRIPNPRWRPFLMKSGKRLLRQTKPKGQYELSHVSIDLIVSVLRSIFTFLQQEGYIEHSPVDAMRRRARRQQRNRVTRRLSNIQWEYVVKAAEKLASFNKKYDRSLFLISALYLLGVRISELSHSKERPALMGNFAPDKRGLWWFTTIGKGNKMRDIAVPYELLTALKRYRESMGLVPLPMRDEATCIFPSCKGTGGLGARQIRSLVQEVFDKAILQLQKDSKLDEALDLSNATVHWIRHTTISNDVEFRPREHIRDDVGHENPATLDKYIDIDRIERHKSAQLKKLRPAA